MNGHCSVYADGTCKCMERIRALESEKAALEKQNSGLNGEIMRKDEMVVKAWKEKGLLESRVKELEAQLVAQIGESVNVDMAKIAFEMKARAEKSEARLQQTEYERNGYRVDVERLEADCERHRLAAVDFRAIAEKAEADARAANAVVVSLEADLAEAEGIIKDYELWCLDMGRIPIQRAAGRESGGTAPEKSSRREPLAAAKPAARDPDDERECAG